MTSMIAAEQLRRHYRGRHGTTALDGLRLDAPTGITLGLSVPDPDTVGTIMFPRAFPLSAISHVFVAPELMPGRLGTIAQPNPISAATTTLRELFGNPGIGSDSWPAEHALMPALVRPER